MDCLACGGRDFELWVRQGAYEIFRCRVCGLGVTSPAPSGEQLTECNRGAYGAKDRAGVYYSRRVELKKRYSSYIQRIKRFRPSGALLDLGCNVGVFMNVAREKGFSVTGVELNADCAAYGSENCNLDIRRGTLIGAAFRDESFDVVTMYDVLEHVPEPGALLSETIRVLKPGGLLVVQSPNLNSIMAWLLKENWNWLTPPDHLYHFTPEALKMMLKNAGFRIVKVQTWEPARDFTDNIYSGFPARGPAGRIFRKFIWLASLALVPLFQSVWCMSGRGGLIEAYVVKGGTEPQSSI